MASRTLAFFLVFLYFQLVYNLNFTILHTNDIHCRYTEINAYGQRCNNKISQKCFGGVARLKTAIDSKRAHHKDVLLLDAGDVQTGSLWYLAYRGNASSHFLRQLGYDVIVPGNHDFDDGAQQTLKYFQQLSTKQNESNISIVCSNLNISYASLNTKWSMVKNHVIKTLSDGTKVGICGYTIPATKQYSNPPKEFHFSDEIESVRQCAQSLTRNDIKVIVALGHSGIDMDMKIAKEIDEVDIVVGGHTNTFLYSGKPPSTEKPYGPYPIVVRTNGKIKLIVQAYAFGKYLGSLNVAVDEKSGDIVRWSGNPIILSESVKQDQTLKVDVHAWNKKVEVLSKNRIGFTNVSLDTIDCKKGECVFGDLVTDSMRFVANNSDADDTVLAFMTANTIMAPIQKGTAINFGNLFDSLPYQNDLILVHIKGEFIRQALEISALYWGKGQFLQISGLSVTYNSGSDGRLKLKKIFVLENQQNGLVKEELLSDDKTYKAVVTSYIFLYKTFSVFRQRSTYCTHLGMKEIDAVQTYVKNEKDESTVNDFKDGRIKIEKENQISSRALTISGSFWTFLVVFIDVLYIGF